MKRKLANAYFVVAGLHVKRSSQLQVGVDLLVERGRVAHVLVEAFARQAVQRRLPADAEVADNHAEFAQFAVLAERVSAVNTSSPERKQKLKNLLFLYVLIED